MRAVDGVSFTLQAGRTLGLVGESGCGKTTTILEIMEMVAPQGGKIEITGKDVGELGKGARHALREDIQIVFQDPMGAIDPRLPIGDILADRAEETVAERINSSNEPRVESGSRA